MLSSSESEGEEEVAEDVAEKICDKKVHENGIIQYLIKWKGLVKPIWELKEDCNCDELIEDFERELIKDHEKKQKE